MPLDAEAERSRVAWAMPASNLGCDFDISEIGLDGHKKPPCVCFLSEMFYGKHFIFIISYTKLTEITSPCTDIEHFPRKTSGQGGGGGGSLPVSDGVPDAEKAGIRAFFSNKCLHFAYRHGIIKYNFERYVPTATLWESTLMKKISENSSVFFDFINTFSMEHGYPPSVRNLR